MSAPEWTDPPEVVGEPDAAHEELEVIEVELLLEAVYRRYGFDFREYAPASLRRRLWRRLIAEDLSTVTQLQDRLLLDPACMERLLLDLSINVTAMFRDPSFYVALREQVVVVSPSILMLAIVTVQTVLKDARMREQASLIQKEVGLMLQDVKRLVERVGALTRHFGQSESDLREIAVSTEKIVRRAGSIEAVELAAVDVARLTDGG